MARGSWHTSHGFAGRGSVACGEELLTSYPRLLPCLRRRAGTSYLLSKNQEHLVVLYLLPCYLYLNSTLPARVSTNRQPHPGDLLTLFRLPPNRRLSPSCAPIPRIHQLCLVSHVAAVANLKTEENLPGFQVSLAPSILDLSIIGGCIPSTALVLHLLHLLHLLHHAIAGRRPNGIRTDTKWQDQIYASSLAPAPTLSSGKVQERPRPVISLPAFHLVVPPDR
ncbi:hypothetical protein F4808DRAFT_137000 [Astrocystis sublimbata]|nr:hypothetical protein F4808DRAFT_137000 [Astrocystis sublimbata]